MLAPGQQEARECCPWAMRLASPQRCRSEGPPPRQRPANEAGRKKQTRCANLPAPTKSARLRECRHQRDTPPRSGDGAPRNPRAIMCLPGQHAYLLASEWDLRLRPQKQTTKANHKGDPKKQIQKGTTKANHKGDPKTQIQKGVCKFITPASAGWKPNLETCATA